VDRTFGLGEFVFLLKAVPWTILLSLGAMLGGGVLGLIISVARIAPLSPIRWLATGYIEVFQGTPVLMQLFIIYYGLAVLVGVQVDAWIAVLVAFTLYAGAFLGDIWRGCLQAVPRQQWEAAASLSMSYLKQLRYVIVPQAARIAIAPTVGFLVQLIKSTSIAAIIGFVELTRAGQLMASATFQPMIVYPIVAGMYFLICRPLTSLASIFERRSHAATGTKWYF